MKIDEKNWSELEDAEKIAYCENLFTETKDKLQRRHFEWYLNYSFLEGNHYAVYNSTTNSIETLPRKKGEVRLVVNKIKNSIRSVKNYVKRHRPKWEIIPGDEDEDTINNARRAGKFMDYWYRINHFEAITSGVVDSVINTSVAWVEKYWDPKAKGGMGEVKAKLHNSFEIYPDIRGCLDAGKFKGRFICKAIKRDLDSVRNDGKYNKKTRILVKTDDQIAVSEMEARLLRRQDGENNKDKKATIKEFMLYSEEENEKGGNIQLFTYSGDQVLRDEEMKETEFPMYVCQIDLNPNKIYQRSWTADAIPINKALDRSVSQKIMYVNQALVYRILAEKGHGISEISNDMGVVFEINPNRKWEQMPMSGLPNTIDSLNESLERYIEDDLGSHEASFGAVPNGARSGKVLEALQAADSNNLAGIIESLNTFLAVLGSALLDLVAEKYVASRIAKITDPETMIDPETGEEVKTNTIRVIGDGAPDEAKQKGATIINKDNELIVEIGSWLGYTLEQQRETLMELGDKGYIPKEEVIRQMQFPNIRELSEKARSERLEEHQLKAEIAGRKGQAGGQNPEDDMIAMADEENLQMANGNPLPPTEGATPEHTQAHIDFTSSRTFQELPAEVQQIFQQHIEGERQEMGV